MRKATEETPDPASPTLLVTYGNTTRKVRPLDRDLLVLGRASACDINLVSPEVANIHALILHAAAGWRVRDCGSRLGTRLNGRAVHESALEDGDVLQIGSFSFHLNLPGKSAHGTSLRPENVSVGIADPKLPAGDKQVQKLERSRRHLAELALSLRQRCHGFQERASALRQAEMLAEERHADLARQREALRSQQQEAEMKAGQLAEAENDLKNRRAALEKERADFQGRQQRAESAIARLQADAETRLQKAHEQEAAMKESEASFAQAAAELHKLRADLDEREARLARQETEALAQREQVLQELAQARADLAAATAPREEPVKPSPDETGRAAEDERLSALERRDEELNSYAQHLRRCQQELADRERAIAEAREQLQQTEAMTLRSGEEQARTSAELAQRAHELEQRELQMRADRDALLHEKEEMTALHARQRQETMNAQAELREQRSEILRLLGEVRQARQEARPPTDADVDTLNKENEELRRQLALHQAHIQSITEAADKQIADAQQAVQQLQGEANELAHHLEDALAEAADLARKVETSPAGSSEPARSATGAELEMRLAGLATDLQARDTTIQRLQEELHTFKNALETSGGYEMELHGFRLQVERERKALEEERSLLRRHQDELQEELRQAELQLARERAQMARDRTELLRLRDEIQMQREHIERVGAMQERLAPLHRMRADLHDKKPASAPK